MSFQKSGIWMSFQKIGLAHARFMLIRSKYQIYIRLWTQHTLWVRQTYIYWGIINIEPSVYTEKVQGSLMAK